MYFSQNLIFHFLIFPMEIFFIEDFPTGIFTILLPPVRTPVRVFRIKKTGCPGGGGGEFAVKMTKEKNKDLYTLLLNLWTDKADFFSTGFKKHRLPTREKNFKLSLKSLLFYETIQKSKVLQLFSIFTWYVLLSIYLFIVFLVFSVNNLQI